LSDDYSSSDQVVLDTIKQLSLRGLNFNLVCCIYATTPFLEASDLRKGLNQLLESDSDFLIGATKVRFPMERTYLKLNDFTLAPSDPSAYLSRSQDLPERYVDAGQFYWGTNQGWERVVNFGIGTPAFTELTWEKGLDIDTLDDWEIAQTVFRKNHHFDIFARARLRRRS
jgi:N-acylneuraminate cytidylyltransferase